MNPPPSLPSPDALRAADAIDRRRAQRCSCDNMRPVQLLVRPSFQALPAFIRDFSQRGVGLISMRPFEAGTMVALQLRKRQVGVSDILTAHVRYVRQLANHYWFVGCRLSRSLSDDERRCLLHGYAEKTMLWSEDEW